MSDTVYVGLGSNEGDREAHLVAALESLSRIDAVAVLHTSSLYESAPIGPAQPRYLNAAVALACDLAPQRLLAICKHIERERGRTRGGPRWGPRPLDLDILLWEERVIADATLQVPHLQVHKRRFALQPLLELCPDLRHPILGRTVSELLAALEPQDVLPHESPHWPPCGGWRPDPHAHAHPRRSAGR